VQTQYIFLLKLVAAMAPQYALFIQKQWCDKIFNEEKTWELRSFPLPAKKKGEVVAIACSKANLLLGEVRLKGFLKVGSKSGGGWEPASNSNKHVKNFFLDAKNARKVGFDRDGVPKVINDYKQIFAWILRDVKKYDTPKAWTPTRGAVTFCKIKSGQ